MLVLYPVSEGTNWFRPRKCVELIFEKLDRGIRTGEIMNVPAGGGVYVRVSGPPLVLSESSIS